MADGTAIQAVTLANAHGMTATVMTLGASVQSVDHARPRAAIAGGHRAGL